MNRPSCSIVKGVAWSDGGCEFVCADGTVMSFASRMETVAISEGPHVPIKFAVTAWSLSKYRERIISALNIYNSLSPNPRLMEGFIPTYKQVGLWPDGMPIDSLVVSNDPKFFSLKRVQNGDSVASAAIGVLRCVLGHVFLYLHPDERVFSVSWPAPVMDADGSSHVLLQESPGSSYVRGIRYVIVDQVFSTLNPPAEWLHMLQVAQNHRRRSADASVDTSAEGTYSEIFGTLPRIEMFVNGSANTSLRFPDLRPEDVDTMRSTSELQNVSLSERLHPPPAQIIWRLDTEAEKGLPSAIYWSFVPRNIRPGGRSEVLCYVLEDWTTVYMQPTAMEEGASSEDFVLSRTSILVDKCSQYFSTYSHSGEVANLPPSLYGGLSLAVLAQMVRLWEIISDAAGMQVCSRLAFVPRDSTAPGRYLRSIASTCASLSLLHRRRVTVKCEPSSGSSVLGCGRLVRFSSRIADVGVFYSLSNGVDRGVFDDRAIVTLIPSGEDQETGLIANMLSPDGITQTIRVVHCTPDSPFHSYLQYLVPFRHFARHEGIFLGGPGSVRTARSTFGEGGDGVCRVDLLLHQTRDHLNVSTAISSATQSLLFVD